MASLHYSLPLGNPLRDGLYWLRRTLPGVEAVVSIARTGRLPSGPMMQINSYSPAALTALFVRSGFEPPVVVREMHGARPTAHLTARRRPG